MHKFSERIKELRNLKNLSLSEFAKMIHIDVRTLKKWEKGNCRISSKYVFLVSAIFNVSVNWLAGIDNDINISNK